MKNIQLVKRQEDVNRNFEDGKETETVNRVNYRVMRDGNEIGSADVYPTSVNVNLYNTGGNSISDNVELVEKMFNAISE